MSSGEALITLICVIETAFLAWGWRCGGFRRVNIPPCSERLAYLERQVEEIREQMHADRNTLNRTVLWVDYQRTLEKRDRAVGE